MEIRKAIPEDIARILEITKVAWGTYSMARLMEDRYGIIGGKRCWEYKVMDLKRQCEEALDRIFVAVEDGANKKRPRVVGYATFGVDEARKIGHVLNNAVDPEYQRRGIGTALNRRVLDEFKGRGMCFAAVTTMKHDLPARRVYEKHGFQEIARSVHYTMAL